MGSNSGKNTWWKILAIVAIILFGLSTVLFVMQLRKTGAAMKALKQEKNNYRKYDAVVDSKLNSVAGRDEDIDSLKEVLAQTQGSLKAMEQEKINIVNKYNRLKNEMDTISSIDGHINMARRLHAINRQLPLERK